MQALRKLTIKIWHRKEVLDSSFTIEGKRCELLEQPFMNEHRDEHADISGFK